VRYSSQQYESSEAPTHMREEELDFRIFVFELFHLNPFGSSAPTVGDVIHLGVPTLIRAD